MKLIAMFGAAALMAGTVLTATPAEAQRHGWDRGDRDGWHDRGRRGWDRQRGWDRGRGYGYGRDYGYNRGNRGWNRGRVVCRMERGYYGPVRRCFRVYR
ncbi:MAG: hypothetical protein PGN08_10705 [Sphingomonas taxi]